MGIPVIGTRSLVFRNRFTAALLPGLSDMVQGRLRRWHRVEALRDPLVHASVAVQDLRVHADMLKFMPDSSVISDVIPSANYGERRNNRAPDMIVLHYTGMKDAESALARLCKAGTEVSAHYVVMEDGRIVQCVPEARRAWHAGTSQWAGETDLNSCSIGVEIINGGHDRAIRISPPARSPP